MLFEYEKITIVLPRQWVGFFHINKNICIIHCYHLHSKKCGYAEKKVWLLILISTYKYYD